MRLLYARKEGVGAPFLIQLEDAKRLNDKRYGIFHTIQQFSQPERTLLKKIEFFAIDIDCGPDKKESVLRTAMNYELIPSKIIESRNGFHIYWELDSTPDLGLFNEVMKSRLIPYFDADRAVCHPKALLRLPGFFNWKNEDEPFLVKIIFTSGKIYSIEQFLGLPQLIYFEPKAENRQITYKDYLEENIDILELFESLGGEFHSMKLAQLISTLPSSRYEDCYPKNNHHSIGIMPEKRLFKCFGCETMGGPIKLVQMALNLPYYEAIRYLERWI